jgi:hypothetical protein
MKLNYLEFCYGGIIKIDDDTIRFEDIENKENLDKVKGAIYKMIDTYLSDSNNVKNIFRDLISFSGEYEDSKRCDQCGNYDTNINLEI